MDIHTTQARQAEYGRWEDPAVSGHNDEIGCHRGQCFRKRSTFKFARLEDGNALLLSRDFHRGGLWFFVPTTFPIRLGDARDESAVGMCVQCLHTGNGKRRGAHEDHTG